MSAHKMMKQAIRQYERLGCSATKTRRNHWRIDLPNMKVPVFAPSTPSDYRSIKNFHAEMRRKLRP